MVDVPIPDPPGGYTDGDTLTLVDPNFLVILYDDVSCHEFRALGELERLQSLGVTGIDVDDPLFYAPTPTYTEVFSQGVGFQRMYSTPLCSPSRAAMHTMRYPHHNGVLNLADVGTRPLDLNVEYMLPRVLDEALEGRYACGLFGKLHLSNQLRDEHTLPIVGGWDIWQGPLRNLQQRRENYYHWYRTTAKKGAERPVYEVELCTNYVTTQTVDDAIAWIRQQTKPWLIFLHLTAAHAPLNRPPEHLYDTEKYDLPFFEPQGGGSGDNDKYFRAIINAADTECGRLIASLSTRQRANTHVCITSDNGTDAGLLQVPPFNSSHGKRSIFEQGLNVGMTWAGPGVNGGGRLVQDFAQLEDIGVTICDILGIDLAASFPGHVFDGISFKNVLSTPGATGLRSFIWTQLSGNNRPEVNFPQGGLSCCMRVFPTDNKRYKLAHFAAGVTFPSPGDFFFNVSDDPLETTNLLDASGNVISAADQDAYEYVRDRYLLIAGT